MKGDWRENLKNAQLTGERLEKRAHAFGITDLPFRIEPYARHLDWTEWEKPLSDFRDRVLMISKMIGRPPDATEKRADGGVVVLKAKWVFDVDGKTEDWHTDKVFVGAYATTNCRVIVDGEEITRTPKIRVHPECVEVVDRLEDLDEADWQGAPSEYVEAAL